MHCIVSCKYIGFPAFVPLYVETQSWVYNFLDNYIIDQIDFNIIVGSWYNDSFKKIFWVLSYLFRNNFVVIIKVNRQYPHATSNYLVNTRNIFKAVKLIGT